MFVGLTSYYQRLIPHFASRQIPDRSDQELLVTPDFSKTLVVQTDKSEIGVGSILSQLQEGEERGHVHLPKAVAAGTKIFDSGKGMSCD